ncbi:mannose-1-phosphate guanylyltransferase [Patescibacteria group bacterium]|nr:MAG: mannose-1-phosphate guanylyltransferase [Patescibacteria group bacterium]
MKAILMTGGSGTRLWPLSRKSAPKQVRPFLDDKTMLEHTWNRLLSGIAAKDVYVATTKDLAAQVRRVLPRLKTSNLSVEPVRRETAPALALALLKVLKDDPRATVVYANVDNHISDTREFHRMLGVAEHAVRKYPDRLVLLGVRPAYPETGYGYIKMGGQKVTFGKDEVFAVEAFKEKPDLKTAKRYVASWEYLWNPTLVVARAQTLADAYKKHAPKLWKVMEQIAPHVGTPREAAAVKRWFPKAPSITIDYALLEKEKGMLVIPADFGWTDVGHWRTVHDILAGDKDANVVKGKAVVIDGKRNLLFSETGKFIGAVGVEDLILVETEDAILVASRERAQDVKKLVQEIERRKFKNVL